MMNASHPSQEDAIRLTDSLGLADNVPSLACPGSASAERGGSSSSSHRNAPEAILPDRINDYTHPAADALPTTNPTSSSSDFASAARRSKSSIQFLPAEVLLYITSYLFAPQSTTRKDYRSLLHLSSTCAAFRSLLSPLIWWNVRITDPQSLPKLFAILDTYRSFSLPTTTASVESDFPSKSSSRLAPADSHQICGWDASASSNISATLTNTTTTAVASTDDHGHHFSLLRHPLQFIHSIEVNIPDRYPDFDQTYLIELIRCINSSCSLSRSIPHHSQFSYQGGLLGGLQRLVWSSEVAPHPSAWTLLAPTLTTLDWDGRTFHQGRVGDWVALSKLQDLTVRNYDATLLPANVEGFFLAQANRHNTSAAKSSTNQTTIGNNKGNSSSTSNDESIGRPANDTISSSLGVQKSFSLSSHLKRLTMCTSKTSLLHTRSLISANCFVGLQHIDLYPVTPEPPLDEALLSCRSTLVSLRLVLDISASFRNFDSLFHSLATNSTNSNSNQDENQDGTQDQGVKHGGFPCLTTIFLDPLPQQNTAPNFFNFISKEVCPNLTHINGKNIDSYPPCLGTFDPDTPSGALPY